MKKFVIGFIILLAVVAIGVGGYFLWDHFNNSNDTHKNEATNSSTENSQIKRDENKGRITKIIGVKELEEDIVGKYTTKMEATFLDGKFTTIKASFYDIKDEYILQTLKANYEKSDIADKIVIGDKSFSYELTAEEYAEYLKNPDVITLVTRNYIYSNLKKNGYTVTVEGDDSFLGDNRQTLENTEQSSSETSNSNKKNSNTSSSIIDVDSMINQNQVNEATEKAEEKLDEMKSEMTQEQREAIEEAQRDIERATNGTYEDKKEVIEKYENKAREELESRGYNYDDLRNQAQEQYERAKAQYGL